MIHHLMWRSTVALTGWDISGYHTKKHDALKIALLAYFRKERERERGERITRSARQLSPSLAALNLHIRQDLLNFFYCKYSFAFNFRSR